MVWLIVGVIVALVTLLLLFVVVMEVLIVRSERGTPQWLRSRKRYPYGRAFLTFFLMVGSASLLMQGLNQTVFYPYRLAADDDVNIANEDKHLSIEVWLKKVNIAITKDLSRIPITSKPAMAP